MVQWKGVRRRALAVICVAVLGFTALSAVRSWTGATFRMPYIISTSDPPCSLHSAIGLGAPANRVWQPASPAALPSSGSNVTDLVRRYSVTKELLAQRADKDGTVMLTFTTAGWRDFLHTWVVSVERAGITNYVVGALDMAILRECDATSIPAIVGGVLEEAGFESQGWGDESFHKIQRSKQKLILQVLDLGFNLLMTDVDQYWYKNPMPYLRSFPEPDILTSTDCPMLVKCLQCIKDMPELNMRSIEPGFSGLDPGICDVNIFHFNIGCTLFRSRDGTKRLIQEWIATLDASAEALWDQQVFNDIIKRTPPSARSMFKGSNDAVYYRVHDGSLVVGALPITKFPNGLTYFSQGLYKHTVTGRIDPFMAHANYMGVHFLKVMRFREAMCWDSEPPEYWDPPEKLMAYRPQIPGPLEADGVNGPKNIQLIERQLFQLQNAFSIAQALGRVLVMPRLLGEWPSMHTRDEPPSPDFPEARVLDQVADVLKLWKPPGWTGFTPAIREYTFLANPRVPAAVRLSKLTVEVWSELGADCAGFSTDGLAHVLCLRPHQLERIELLRVLDPFKSVKVVEFSSLNYRMQGYKRSDKGRWNVLDALHKLPWNFTRLE